MRAKMSKGKIIFNVINLILLLLMMYIIFIPKRPFFWLTEDMVEKIENRYAYHAVRQEALYAEVAEEYHQQVVDGLRKIKITQPQRSDIMRNYSGGPLAPTKITLKNGMTLYYDVQALKFFVIVLKDAETVGTGYGDPIVIFFKLAKDEETKEGALECKAP